MGAPSREDVETICAAALDLPPGERQAFLARSCGHDPVLAQRVRSLLADYERLGSTLDHAVWSSGRHRRRDSAPDAHDWHLRGALRDRVGGWRWRDG